MPQEETPESIVEAFASQPVDNKKCKTCSHPRVDEINRACAKFSEMKLSGDTTQSWNDFRKYVLVPAYGYTLVTMSIRRHMRECLGYE